VQLFLLWALYNSLVNVGQTPYGFGWESQLLETGFLAIFFCPLRHAGAVPTSMPPPSVGVWAARWLLFRIMIGAGLIKLRGDRCWRDLSAMDFFYETQPVPNPLSRRLHFAPRAWHRFETFAGLWIVEIVTPFLLLLPGGGTMGLLRSFAAVLQIFFQFVLISSGNLSFLNWLTIAPTFLCLSDANLASITAPATRAAAAQAAEQTANANALLSASNCMTPQALATLALGAVRPHHVASALLLFIVVRGSVPVVANLLELGGRRQVMNTAFGAWRTVNTYGAFGSVTRTRYEVILQGTSDALPTADAHWREYEFRVKPGAVSRRPPFLSPFHYRLDWLMWFLPFSSWRANGWLLRLVAKLLTADVPTRQLLRMDPFDGITFADVKSSDRADAAEMPLSRESAPKWIRGMLYEYRFAPLGEQDHWNRTLVREYLPPVSLATLAPLLQQAGLPPP